MLLFYTMVALYLFYDGAVVIQICQCKVSDTQVTVKACGPLVYFCRINFHKHSQMQNYRYMLLVSQCTQEVGHLPRHTNC